VDEFLPQVQIPKRFDVENPGYVAAVVSQAQYEGYRRLTQEAMGYALELIEEVDSEFRGHFGRGYGLIEAVNVEDAELVLVTSGTITSTARVAMARLREKGHKVGLVKIRVFRPFPTRALRRVLDRVPRIAVVERNLSLGREGIFCSELKSALVNSPVPHQVQGYLAGIGGTDVNADLIERVALDALQRKTALDEPIWMTEERT
jgi:pyruvate/2-oxoacid:ferredoxin oxidoreductase alpha subunit